MEDEIKEYLSENLGNIEYIGDLQKENSEYTFSAKVKKDTIIDFENEIYTVKSIDYTDVGCYVKLGIIARFLEYLVKQNNK